MTSRILPRDEWHRVADLDVAGFAPYMSGDDMQIVVVEQGTRIVGCWAVLRIVHLEGVWIDPEYRGRVGVARRLLAGTLETAQSWGAWAWTGCASDDVRRLIERHLHGVRMPMDTYAIPLREEAVCQQR